jgi:hypothetical protein
MMVVVWLVTTLLVTRWSAPWVFGSALLACLLMGLVDINIVLAKATNEGLVTLVLLMLISVGFERLPLAAYGIPAHGGSIVDRVTFTRLACHLQSFQPL